MCRLGFRVVVWLLCVSATASISQAADILKIHEWGTFTSFQDESGVGLAHINTDDEPVPKFVHQLFYEGRFSPTNMPSDSSKGVPRAHSQVTMRLETPVTYFHLPQSVDEMTLDLSVKFHGGWLTEFFPKAKTDINGREVSSCKKEKLSGSTVGGLSWNGIRLGGNAAGPATDDHVWLAPRDVRAAQVNVGDEAERFLFYRGVGHREAPLRVVRDPSSDQLQLQSPPQGSSGQVNSALTLSKIWLVEIAPDGATAFRTVPEITVDDQPSQILAVTSASFAAREFSKDNLAHLRSSMHAALVEQGLFADEARALLNTWDLSYFQSPGLRLFFLVPQSWTDDVLPLEVSVPAEITRIMVGRIELVTPRHRQLLRKIAAAPVANLTDVTRSVAALRASESSAEREHYNALASGRGQSFDLGVPVPDNYQWFIELGRFRSSLLLNGCKNKSLQKGLGQFIYAVEDPEGAYQYHLRLLHEASERQKPQSVSLKQP